MPTGIWSSRLRSGSAHCGSAHWDLDLAVEVRLCPLGSGLRGGGGGGGGGEEEEDAEAQEEENSSDKI